MTACPLTLGDIYRRQKGKVVAVGQGGLAGMRPPLTRPSLGAVRSLRVSLFSWSFFAFGAVFPFSVLLSLAILLFLR